MTTDLSFRIDYQLYEEIKWAKEELQLENKSDVARKLIHYGVDYLKKAKEMVENPKISDDEKQEYTLILEKFKNEKIAKDFFSYFSDDDLNMVVLNCWKEQHQRKIDKTTKEKELTRIDRELEPIVNDLNRSFSSNEERQDLNSFFGR